VLKKIWYQRDAYQSHKRVSQTYKRLLSRDYEMAAPRLSSDIVILHKQPWDYAALYEELPWLRDRYVISYCTWEASELPERYKASLELVQEVWTCSTYCAEVIAAHNPRTTVIPHVIERNLAYSDNDERLVKRIIAYDERLIYFLNFGDTKGSRKNTKNLVKAFTEVESSMPHARLVILGSPDFPWLDTNDSRIIHIPLQFSDAQLNCLYSLATAYVSPHHSEGWGLTLSDATLFDIPVIGTEYSGNLEFMSRQNSFLIRAKEVFIKEDQIYHLFTTSMKWGEPDYTHCQEIMIGVYESPRGTEIQERVAAARQLRAEYSSEEILRRMKQRIDDISI
jgi:glycosyltransferase involved in cell wall biosynthesis